jgi:hypothetical protein
MEFGFKPKQVCKLQCFGLEDQEQRIEDQKAKWKDNYIIFYLEYKRRISTSPTSIELARNP